MRDLALPLSILALAAAIAWSSMPHAQAEGPGPGVVCEAIPYYPQKSAVWITDQLSQGRTRFLGREGAILCAW